MQGEAMTTTIDQESATMSRRSNGEPEPRLLQLENIHKVFTTDEVETHALSAVFLEIRRGEFVSISGPSGCGKSTLLSIIGLLDSPSDGTYRLEGKPIQMLSAVERA